MGIEDLIDILSAKYSLCDLEDKLGAEVGDMNNGLEDFIKDYYDDIIEMLEEDGWLT